MTERVAVPRAVVERLRELRRLRANIDAEAGAYLEGVAVMLGISPEQVAGVDDGDDPALLLEEPEPQAD